MLAGHLGDAATALAHLHDPDPKVRASAISAAVRCDALEADALLAAATDPDPAPKRAAAEAVAGAQRPRSAAGASGDAVVDVLLGDDDASIVEVGCWAAGERDARPEVVSKLSSLATTHDDALVREAAVAALGALGDPEGLPAVLRGTQDKASVRRRAVVALAAFEGDEVDQALRAAAQDRDRQVRQAAEDLLRPELP